MEYSILQYGSSARGDSDKYSDKDLLVVTESYYDLEYVEALYSRQEWSISFYTYNKLEYLAKNGYLFIKHLIDEGNIQIDPNKRLYQILQLFKEQLDYSHEIKKTEEFFNFLRTIPDNKASYSWLCDNIYVNLRNQLIYKSANAKKFTFSYLENIQDIMESGFINEREFKILKELRVLKSCYRNNYSDITPNRGFIDELLPVVKKFYVKLDFSFTEDCRIWKHYDLNLVDSSYKKLRLIELLFLNLGLKDEKMFRYISNPQMYANCRLIDKVSDRLLTLIITEHNQVLSKVGLKG